MKVWIVSLGLACAAASSAAAEDRVPWRAPGLWETTTITNAGKSGARECIDERTDRLVRKALAGQSCKNDTFRLGPDGAYAAGATCTGGGRSIEGRVVVTGDFATWARAEASTTMSGFEAGGGTRSFTTTIDTRRLGDCEPGQAPGDLILPNGKIISAPAGR